MKLPKRRVKSQPRLTVPPSPDPLRHFERVSEATKLLALQEVEETKRIQALAPFLTRVVGGVIIAMLILVRLPW